MKALLFILFLIPLSGVIAHEKHEHKSDTAQTVKFISDTASQSETTAHNHEENSHENRVTNFPNYHPLVVHFPIVLLIIAMLFQLISFFIYKNELSFAVVILLAFGTISAWLSSYLFHAHPSELPGNAQSIFQTHELFAQYTLWFALSALVVKLVSHFFLERKAWIEAVVSILLLTSAITVSVAGHHGAQLVHIEGVGPKGNLLETHHHNH